MKGQAIGKRSAVLWGSLLMSAVLFSALVDGDSQQPTLNLTFTASSPADSKAAAEYRTVWASEASRIVNELQKRSGLRFQESQISVVVLEAPSESGYGNRPMRLRSSYPEKTKRGTLIHELGHRLQSKFFRRDEEDHPYLFLYLYDVWVALYGTEFANEQVEVESLRKGYYDYKKAWQKALAMTPSERLEKWQRFLQSRLQN